MERVQSEKNQGPRTQPYGTPRIKDQVEENERTKKIEKPQRRLKVVEHEKNLEASSGSP